MPLITYTPKNFSATARRIIEQANEILNQYAAQGYDLTLRQLYYQFVSRDILPNRQNEYKRLGDIISEARRAGLIDWDHIVDRTRNLRRPPHWTNPGDIINSAAQSFRRDKWADQPVRVEAWIEKDALLGVLERACLPLAVPYFSCRGYNSDSEMWAAAQRILDHNDNGQRVIILHLGDHDPSGVDMTRDIRERLLLFTEDSGDFEIRRLALNWDQIEEYDPPPNPAKLTDSRANGYIERYGDDSWELDALEPQVINDLIRTEVENVRDEDAWQAITATEERDRLLLAKAARQWNQLARVLA